MDPSNPDVLYAASLERERREYGFLPAGPESGIYKTRDAGRTWTQLAGGLPTGELGRIGLAVCRSKPSTFYAVIHAKGPANGIYRSDDTGSTWRQVNGVNATAWYYSQVRCDPSDPEHVISLSATSRESFDGGKNWTTFAQGNGVHGDHHALWINPETPEQMILGTDGGLNMSWDHGRTWSHTSRTSWPRSSTRSPWTTRSRSTTCTADCRTTSSGADRAARATPSARRTPTGSACTAATASTPSPIRGITTSCTPRCRAAAWCATTSARARRRTSSLCRRRASGTASTGARRFCRRATIRRPCTWRRTTCSEPRSRRQLGHDQPRPHARHRPQQAADARRGAGFVRARPQRGDGGVQQHLDGGRIAVARGVARRRHRRRPHPGHARRREELVQDGSLPRRSGHDVREPRGVLEGERGNDLRDVRRTPQQRLQAVRAEEHGLRQDVDVDRRRICRTAAPCR